MIVPDTKTSLRIAFWNTWLLRPRVWPGGPAVPFGDRLFAPQVPARSPLIGPAVRDRFDVVALGECFESEEQDAVAKSWPEATVVAGPQRRRRKFTGSGLMTLVSPLARVTHHIGHSFTSGGDWRDSDTFATKGALFTRVQAGDLEIDVVSTHLLAGGDLFPIPGHDDTVRHHDARMAQVDELVAFIQRQRSAAAPLLLVGDFNVCAHDHEPRLAEPAERYRDLAERLTPLGVSDVWADHGIGPGHTCTFTESSDLPADPEDPDCVADDPDASPATAAGERIDYLWLGDAPNGSVTVRAERPRRWAFPGRDVQGGPAGSLSDHLALSVTLHLVPAA